MKPLTKEKAVRIAYECARDFRDVAGGCGGVGPPWDDLTADQRKVWEQVYDGQQVKEYARDIDLFRVVVDHLNKLL